MRLVINATQTRGIKDDGYVYLDQEYKSEEFYDLVKTRINLWLFPTNSEQID